MGWDGQQTLLSPVDGLFSQVMGNMHSWGGVLYRLIEEGG